MTYSERHRVRHACGTFKGRFSNDGRPAHEDRQLHSTAQTSSEIAPLLIVGPQVGAQRLHRRGVIVVGGIRSHIKVNTSEECNKLGENSHTFSRPHTSGVEAALRRGRRDV
jgi:hypothetical protein